MRRMRKGLAIALSIAMTLSTGTPAIASNAADTGSMEVTVEGDSIQNDMAMAVTASTESDVDLSLIGADGQLSIDAKAFPDENFKTFVGDNFDSNKDSKLSAGERTAVIELTIHNSDLVSLKGIGYFNKITALNVNNCSNLNYINVNDLTELVSLDCCSTSVTGLNLDNNINLEELNCQNSSEISSISVVKNQKLKSLTLNSENITSLLLDNPKLEYLDISGTGISTINLNNSPELKTLDCSMSKLTVLNLNNNSKLQVLKARMMTGLSSLDLSGLAKLTNVNISGWDNQTKVSYGSLTSLDVSGATSLSELVCSGNKIQTLTFGGNTALATVDASHTMVSNIDLSGAANLVSADFSDCKLESIDVSNNKLLETLKCSDNNIGVKGDGYDGVLNLSNNANLVTLECNNNSLTALDISGNTNLQSLSVDDNLITVLNLDNNSNLKDLKCNRNHLTGLDVTKCADGITVACSGNTYEIELDPDSKYTYDLHGLPVFTPSTATDKVAKYIKDEYTTGGNIVNYRLTPNLNAAQITYRYEIGTGSPVSFTLKIKEPFSPVAYIEGKKANFSGNQNIVNGTSVTCSVKQGEKALTGITLTSENDKVVKINTLESETDTELEAVGAGDVKIYVNYDGRQLGYFNVHVEQKVEGVELNETSIELISGNYSDSNSFTLVPSITPDNADNKTLIWTSSDTRVATVVNGVVTAKGKGTATITCKTNDGSQKEAACEVTVSKQLANAVKINNGVTSFEVAKNGTFKLNAVVEPATADDTSLVWESLNPDIATVDSNGIVTAKEIGDVTIVCRSVDYVEGRDKLIVECKGIVKPGVTEITIDRTEDPIVLIAGMPITVKPSAKIGEEKYNGNFKWVSGDTSVVTVSGNVTTGAATITGVKAGETSVTCTADDGSGYSVTFNVSVKQNVTGIKITENGTQITAKSIAKNTSYKPVLEIIPENAYNKDYTWTLSAQGIVEIAEDGTITALNEGTVIVNYKAAGANNIISTLRITVTSPVVSIVIPDSLVLNMNGNVAASKQITPVTTTESGTAYSSGYVWTSSDEKVAKVSPNGVVTTVGAGKATITCTANDCSGVYAVCEVTVNKIPNNIVISEANKKSTALVGEKLKLSVTLSPEDVSSTEIIWSSLNTDVLEVDQNGNVTVKNFPGTASYATAAIRASLKDNTQLFRDYSITVYKKVTAIDITGGNSVFVNQNLTLTATVTPNNAYNRALKWTSSNQKVATVSNGVVRGISKGKATIKCEATDGSGVIKTTIIEVKQPVTAITVNGVANRKFFVGKSYTLTAACTPQTANNRAVTWTSSNPSVATVSATGVITVKSVGNTVITATAKDGSLARGTATVIASKAVSSIKLSSTQGSSVFKGKSTVLNAIIAPADAANRSLLWTSSNPKVATVSGGMVTGIAKGTATITCKASDGSGVSASYKITVKQPVTSIKITAKKNYVFVKKTLALKAKVAPKNANNRKVKWSSSDKKIATVSSKGVVKGRKTGTVTITCKAADGSGIIATYLVNVRVPVKSIVVKNGTRKINGKTISLKKGTSLALTLVCGPSTATDKSVTWKSSRSKTVSVSPNGVVTGVRPGTVTITVRANDGSGKKVKFKVKVKR